MSMASRFSTIMFGVILTWTAAAMSQQLPAPFAIEFDSIQWDPIAAAARESLIGNMAPAEVFQGRTVDAISNQMTHRFAQRAGFAPVTGIAHIVEPSGRFERLRFRTLPDANAFAEFIEFSRKRRGDDTTTGGTEFRRVLSNPPPIAAPEGKPQIRLRDGFYAFDNGHLVWGSSPKVLHAPFAELEKLSQRGTGKDWALWIDLKSVPAHQRRDYLQQIQTTTSVGLQQRDAEPVGSYLLRRTFGQNYLDLWQSFLFDVDEVYAWTREPRDDEPFRAHFEIRAKHRSDLATLIRELQPGRRSTLQVPSDNVVSAAANFTIPAMFRPGLHALVTASPLNGTQLDTVFRETIDAGQCELAVWARATSNSEPIVGAKVQTATELLDARIIADMLGGTVSPEGTAIIPIHASASGQSFGEHQLEISLVNSQLQLSSELRDAKPTPQSTPDPDPDFVTVPQALISVHVDLGSWSDDGEETPTRQLLRNLERAYQQWTFDRIPSAARLHHFGSGKALTHFFPLVPKINTDGQWELDLVVHGSADGETLSLDITAGRELYAFFHARQLLTNAAFNRLRPDATSNESRTFQNGTKSKSPPD